MTMVTIDGELEEKLRVAATERGQSLDEFVSDVLRGAVGEAGVRLTTRDGLPVFEVPPGTPPIDPRAVRRQLEERGTVIPMPDVSPVDDRDVTRRPGEMRGRQPMRSR